MVIAELPFWTLLIMLVLPITIGVLLMIRTIQLLMDIMKRFDKGEAMVLQDFAELLLFLMFMTGIVGIIYYLLGEQPETFSIFDFLIVEMLPLTWYFILLYGILINLQILFRSGR